MTKMSTGDDAYTYSVAWFDAVTRGKHLGRAVLTRGNKARLADLPSKLRRGDPLQVRGAVAGHHAGGLPQPDGQQGHGEGVQRVLVPQGAEAPGRRGAEHHPVLPSAGHRRRVEPGLRPARVPAVPVRRAVRGRRDLPPLRRDDRQLRPPVVPERAQAVRPGQPGPAVLPDAGLDADRGPADRARPGQALRRPGRAGDLRRRPGLPGQGLPAERRRRSARCTRGWTTSSPYAARSTPAACSTPTWPGDWRSGNSNDQFSGQAPVAAAARRHLRHRAGRRPVATPATAVCASCSPPGPPNGVRRPRPS